MAVASLSGLTFTTLEPRLTDSHGRVIHDLRVSITDRCNYKCVYCRTGEVGAHYPELQIEEYLRLIRVFVGLGISKVRLTGGEPLLRRGLVDMVKELATWRTIEGEPLDLALTTNGHLLEELAAPLKAAGLNRVTVSMDAVDAATFEQITRIPGSFETVLRGVRAARASAQDRHLGASFAERANLGTGCWRHVCRRRRAQGLSLRKSGSEGRQG